MPDLYISQALTNMAQRYTQSETEFIAGRVFPGIPSTKQGGIYYVFDKGEWFRTETAPRAPGTETRGVTWGTSQENYYCINHGLHSDITDEDRADADSIFQLDKIHTDLVTRKNLLSREIIFGQKFFRTGLWTGSTTTSDITPSILFDVSGSTPLQVITAQMDSMQEKTGFRPNKLTFGQDVFSVLKFHAQILGSLGDASLKKASEKTIASLLGLDEVLVTGVTNNTAVEGAADAMAFLYKKNMLLTYSPKSPSKELPSAGYTFEWSGRKGSNKAGHRIKKYRLESIASDRIEGEQAFDQKITGPDLGVFFDGVIS
ncbi:MAG: hypothetical protein GY841_24150 [FCB group bacterium]|nr:hypothetical protein [FCB group bacterium]